MKRVVGIGILLNIIALSCLAKMASPAFAVTKRASVATHAQTSINITRAASRVRQILPAWRYPRQNNQSFVGNSNSRKKTYYRGHNQDNTGNQGYNFRHNQDNAANGANQLINQGRKGNYRQNNQSFVGNSYSSNYTKYIGDNQHNSGNLGYNRGDNQDNGSNSGNQIVN